MVHSLNETLAPVVDEVGADLPAGHRETLLWMLMEITLNALNSRLGSALRALSGLSGGRLLDVLGVNVLYPDESVTEMDYSGPEAKRLAGLLGMDLEEFVRLPLRGKFDALGVPLSPGWVTLETRTREQGSYAVAIRSLCPLHEEDHREVLKRFEDPDGAREEVLERRKPWGDDQGVYRMPSFTGGGGMGLLECIRMAGECGMELEYEPEGDTNRRFARFRISYPQGTGEDR
jgi:hypothetical protein